MTTLKIKVTKEVIEKSKYCRPEMKYTMTGCAISLAVRDIFPNAEVGFKSIYPFGPHLSKRIRLPIEASDFIRKFDDTSPEKRSLLPEIEFEISISDSIIEKINIDEVRPLLENHPTLQLVN